MDETDPPAGLTPPWVLAFFHGTQLPLLSWPRRGPTAVLVSWSQDGELQAQVMRRQGMTVVRGSSSRGGARGLLALLRVSRDHGTDLAFAVDGPRGPRGSVHPGAIAAARHLGALLVPMGAAATPAWSVRSAWDHFLLPAPFARVVVVLGVPLPADTPREVLAEAIEHANARAAAALHGRLRPPQGRLDRR